MKKLFPFSRFDCVLISHRVHRVTESIVPNPGEEDLAKAPGFRAELSKYMWTIASAES